MHNTKAQSSGAEGTHSGVGLSPPNALTGLEIHRGIRRGSAERSCITHVADFEAENMPVARITAWSVTSQLSAAKKTDAVMQWQDIRTAVEADVSGRRRGKASSYTAG